MAKKNGTAAAGDRFWTVRRLLVLALVLAVLILAGVSFLQLRGLYLQGQACFHAGLYREAREIFDGLGSYGRSRELSRECSYILCEQALAAGAYREAAEGFAALGAYRDAALRSRDCTIREAEAALDSGHYEQAADLLEGVEEDELVRALRLSCGFAVALREAGDGEYARLLGLLRQARRLESDGYLQRCREEIYAHACRRMALRAYDEALALFALIPDYGESELHSSCCLRARERFDPARPPVMDDAVISGYIPEGTLYHYRDSYVYLPHEVNEDTAFLLHFSGGLYDPVLDWELPYEYIRDYTPNAVLVFMRSSGLNRIEEYSGQAMSLLEDLAEDVGLTVHDLVVSGASNGGYTALHCSVMIYEQMKVAPRTVLCFDTGMNWEQSYNLNDAQRRKLAETGAELCLFEEWGTAPYLEEPKLLRQAGNRVLFIDCRTGDHERLCANAYILGVFSWAMDRSLELDGREYVIRDD